MTLTRNHLTVIMPPSKTSRKALFRAALAIAGLDGEQWAEREGVTGGHLSQVVAGKRVSKALTAKIDAFVREHLSKHTELAS